MATAHAGPDRSGQAGCRCSTGSTTSRSPSTSTPTPTSPGTTRTTHRPRRPALGARPATTRSARPPGTARLPPPPRARLGCELVASKMKIGLHFESILKRGLLEFASTLPNGAPEFRYAYHEVIEEAQHSLMFQEFVNRSGLRRGRAAPGRTGSAAAGSSGSAGASPSCSSCSCSAARTRSTTCSAASCGPAGTCTRCSSGSCASTSPRRPATSPSPATTSSAPCPGLPRRRRVRLAVAAPLILGTMAQMMLKPSPAARRQVPDPAGGHRRGVHAQPAPPGRDRRLAGQGEEAVRRARARPGAVPDAVAAAAAGWAVLTAVRQADGSRAAGTVRATRRGRCAEGGVPVHRPRA